MRVTANLRFLLPLVTALAAGNTVAFAEAPCPLAPAMPAMHLSHVRSAMERGREVLVVALGSSSTEGVMASDPAHSYPADLQAALTLALPRMHVAVINRGIGGQDALEELARLQADVIAVQPQLVIWQVGANGALRNTDPADFRDMVTRGVQMLKRAGIDVILMDNQHSPRIDAAPEHGTLDAVLAQVAQTTGVGMFSRAALMTAWDHEGVPMITFIATDGLHHNDRGYACVASALADTIVSGVRDTRTLSARR